MTAVLFALLIATPPLRADDVLFTTEHGAKLKVIVRRPTAIYRTPDRNEQATRPAAMFEFFYVARPDTGDARTTNGFYRVATGTAKKFIIGWIPADDAVEWSHRQVLGLRPMQDRQRAAFYESRDDLESAYSPAERQPVPLSLEPQSGGGINLIPIMDRFRMKVDGAEAFAYRVAYLHAMQGGLASVNLANTTIDIVFVIDTTSSMGPYIDATRKAVARLAGELSGEVPVRFGLVAYRDVIANPNGDWYHTKLYCDLESGADHARFLQLVEQLKPAMQDSEDASEDVLAGLQMAIEKAKWNPDAFKHIVLIGDASAHTTHVGPKNPFRLSPQAVLSRAQPRGAAAVSEKIAIHAVRVVSDHPDDHTLAEEHFKAFAGGDEVTGQYHVFNGTDGAPRFVDKLVQLIRTSHEGVVAVRRGETPKSDTPALGLLLDMVKASGASAHVPQFASGFVCELDTRGNQLFEPYVLVQYGTMDLFDSALDFAVKAIRRSGDPDSRDVQRVVQQLKNFVAEINLGERLEQMPLSDFLRLISGIPVRSRIFNYSIADLVAMPEADFEQWVRDVEHSRARVRSHLDNPKVWFSLGSQEMPLAQRHAFLKVSDLP